MDKLSPWVRSVSDPPAGPRSFRDCAREFRLPIHTIVCFEAGRFALTQSSWTTLTQRCSRKWMSGHAAYALVLTADRGQFTTQSFTRRENPSCQVAGNLCFSLTLTYRGCPETSVHQVVQSVHEIPRFAIGAHSRRRLAENRKTVIQSRERTCVIRLRSIDAVDFIDFILE
jgi:hypothetical protein